jgi:hypothetical protein
MVENFSPTETLNHKDLLDYKNSKLPVDDRVADLLNRMTLEEKAAQMLSGCAKTDSSFLRNAIYCGQEPQLTYIWLEAVPDGKNARGNGGINPDSANYTNMINPTAINHK